MSAQQVIRPEDVSAIAERLRALRATTGLSQQKFADSVGLGYSQWANFESARNRIGLDAALTLVRKMGVSLDWIYTGQEAWLPGPLRDQLRQAETQGLTAHQKPLKRA